MEEPIKIIAEPQDYSSCRFRVNRPLLPGASFFFRDPASASGSPLAETLFAVPGVESVLVRDDLVTVTTGGEEDWRSIGPRIGQAIRQALGSGQTPVSDKALESLPPEDEIRRRVEHLFEHQINPALAGHGGWVEVVEVKRNELFLRLGGGCQGCASATQTLKLGIERAIRSEIPEVGAILDSTDHAAGRNPYSES